MLFKHCYSRNKYWYNVTCPSISIKNITFIINIHRISKGSIIEEISIPTNCSDTLKSQNITTDATNVPASFRHCHIVTVRIYIYYTLSQRFWLQEICAEESGTS